MENQESMRDDHSPRYMGIRRPHPEAITREEAAGILGISTASLDRARQHRPDILRSYRLGRHIWLHKSDLDNYIAYLRGENHDGAA